LKGWRYGRAIHWAEFSFLGRRILSGKQRLPAGIDHPVDDPGGMSLPQRRDRRKGVQNVAHGAQPNHKQPIVGLRLQALIFSQE
jgi:hypothetical protein